MAFTNLLGRLGLGVVASLIGGMAANKVVKPAPVETKDYTDNFEDLRDQAYEIHKTTSENIERVEDVARASANNSNQCLEGQKNSEAANVARHDEIKSKVDHVKQSVDAIKSDMSHINEINSDLKVIRQDVNTIKQWESATAAQIDNLTKRMTELTAKVEQVGKKQQETHEAIVDSLAQIDWFINQVTIRQPEEVQEEVVAPPIEEDPFAHEEEIVESPPKKTVSKRRKSGGNTTDNTSN